MNVLIVIQMALTYLLKHTEQSELYDTEET